MRPLTIDEEKLLVSQLALRVEALGCELKHFTHNTHKGSREDSEDLDNVGAILDNCARRLNYLSKRLR